LDRKTVEPIGRERDDNEHDPHDEQKGELGPERLEINVVAVMARGNEKAFWYA
jgi:hypothetical protein